MKKTLLLLTTALAFVSFGQLTPTYNDIMIPMRDGETLEADVYIPAGADSCEVILIQTPYDKNTFENGLPMGVGQNIDVQPFAWVIVDWRGFYGSNQADLSNFSRGEDGYDICEWISNQVWHLDRIGTWGPSALGKVQYLTAKEHHPNHTCAVPMVAHPHQAYNDYFYGGVLEEAHLQTLDLLGYGLSPLVLGNPYYNLTWQFAEAGSWYPEEIHIPTLQIGGWYDHAINTMIDWYEATRTSALAGVQNQQWLLVGPWVHGGTGPAYVGSSIQGELFYPNAEFVSDTMAWEFFQYYLLDAANNWQNTDLITYYELGNDTWSTSNATSIESLTTDVLYLRDGNQLSANTGWSSTSFVSDPSNPAPTIGGANLHINLDQGPYDQISLESRSDIITFETGTLLQDATITGRVQLELYVEADQPDCDIMVHLTDVYPDDRNMLITDGCRRMRFRNGYQSSDETFTTPGNVYPVTIELPFTNYTWKSGHKIKVYIGANSAIRWNVNLQDGGTMYQPGTGNVANISIHHNSTHPSSITLPGSNPSLGTKELVKDHFTMYPNPVNDVLYISSDLNIEKYEITDIKGKIMKEGTKAASIDVEDLPSGIYMIRIQTKNGTSSEKFIKH